MKVLILTNWYPHEGSEYEGVFVRDQAAALALTQDVTLVSIRIISNNRWNLFKGGIRIIEESRFNAYEVFVYKSFPIYNQLNFLIVSFWALRKFLKSRTFDIIHAHTPFIAGNLSRIVSSRLKIPYVITVHNSPFTSLFRTKLHKYITLSALNNADAVFSVSPLAAKEVAKYLKKDKRVHVVPNVVLTHKYIGNKGKYKIKGKINLGFLGGLNTDQKGLDVLFHAFALLRDRDDYFLHVGGNGELLETYKRLAADLKILDNIHFYGSIQPKVVPLFMASLDLFVLSSRHESFGVVVIEAMAAGVPVVATRCGGPESILTPEVGILAEIENPGSIATAIMKWRKNRDDYIARTITEYVQKNFGEISFAHKVSVLYKSIMGVNNLK